MKCDELKPVNEVEVPQEGGGLQMSEHINYHDYGKMLIRASRQVGKSTFCLAQLLNWLSFRDHPQDFKPLEFKMELVSIKEDSK